MTVKEYLNQAYLLDQRIHSHTIECEELKAMAESISSTGFEKHFNASKNTDAPYIPLKSCGRWRKKSCVSRNA